MTKQDREEFIAYLKGCTDQQIVGICEKESKAGRQDYVELVKEEALARGMSVIIHHPVSK